jgi:hypothetical protein
MLDIFEFWAEIHPAEFVHPADRGVFDRVKKHLFDLKCLPACYGGPLRTAKVVLLFQSPGLSEQDRIEAARPDIQDYYVRRRAGDEPFRGPESPGYKWLMNKTKCFGHWEEPLSSKLAILNIGAYHSKAFGDIPLLAALPSSRVSIDWAQQVLFPQAMRGEKVVICLRSARFWGLEEGNQYGQSLFSPDITRGGHMEHGGQREKIIQAVRTIIKM